MSKALALLAGLGAGYMNGEKEKAKQARQDKLDKQQDELHTFKVDEFKRLNDERTALQTTTAPATAREMEGPQTESVIAATPAGQEPAPLGYIAGNGTSARGFAEKGLADAEATAQNKPEARRTRMADLAMQGNAFAATALRDSVQTDAAMGQLKEQTELQGHREFARNVVGSFQKGWGGFTQFATDKFDDGNTYTATEDGKGGAVIVSTGKDGKEVGRQAFASPEEAIAFSVSKADPMQWVDYKTNAANKKADQGNKDREFILSERKTEIAEKQAALAEKKMDFMIYGAAAKARAGVGGGGSGGGAGSVQPASFDPMGSFDEKNAQSVAMEQASKATDEKGAPLKPAAQGELAKQILFGMRDAYATETTNRFVAKTATADLRAASGDPAQYAAAYAKAVQVGVNGAQLSALGFKPPATPASAQPAPQAAAPNVPSRPVAASSAAPRATPAPTRSTDGGKTWTLDVPAQVRDPSVPYFRMIPNPKAAQLSGKSFATRQEAAEAFEQINK